MRTYPIIKNVATSDILRKKSTEVSQIKIIQCSIDGRFSKNDTNQKIEILKQSKKNSSLFAQYYRKKVNIVFNCLIHISMKVMYIVEKRFFRFLKNDVF